MHTGPVCMYALTEMYPLPEETLSHQILGLKKVLRVFNPIPHLMY